MSFPLSKAVNSLRVFILESSRLEGRWDPNYYQGMGEFRRRMKGCSSPVEKLKRSLVLVQYGISERATDEQVGVPMLRMINLQDDAWDVSDLKYIQMSDQEKSPYVLQPEDILFNRTNSKELVGKCGVFNLSGEYVFASYLIRVRVRQGTLRPDYVTAFLSSGLGRTQIDAVSRQIAGMTNINAEEIRELSIPRLDETAQDRVVQAWQAAIRNRDQTLEKARGILSTIDDVLLDELGIPRKPGPPSTLESRVFRREFSEVTGSRFDPFFHAPLFTAHDLDLRSDKRFTRIRAIGHLVRGVVYSSADEQEQGKAIIRATNIDLATGDLDLRQLVHVRPELRFSERQKLKENDILICAASGSKDHAGKVCFIAEDVDGFFGGFMMVLRCSRGNALPEYLGYYMQSGLFRRSIFRHLGGTNINNLSMSLVQSLGVILPEKPRQERILKRIREVKACARTLRDQARADLEKAKREIEALILGQETAK